MAAMLAALALAGCAGSSKAPSSDWEDANAARFAKEGDDALPALPPAPRPAQLVEFSAGGTTDFKFYVDAGSLNVTPDGLVRYVLVARSASGAENVAYEVLNCRLEEYRIYASGRNDGSWERLRAPWRPLGPRTLAQRVLAAEYFCPLRGTISSAAEGAMALRRGGHPRADQPNPLGGNR
jgi:hypothetical protein